MKKVMVTAIVLVLTLLTVMPAAAWDGAKGKAVNSQTLAGWTHGGTVYIVNNTNGNILGTGLLTGTGNFDVVYGADGASCSCVNNTSNSGDNLEVIIVFNAGPGGTPGVASKTFTQNVIPSRFDTGSMKTGTTPTAVTLSSTGTASTDPMPAAIAALTLLLAGATVITLKKQQSAPQNSI